MDDKATQFIQKIASYPEELSLYFSSDLSAQIISQLSIEYGLSEEDLNEIVYDFFLSDFDLTGLKETVSQKINSHDRLNGFVCDFLGRLFFPVASLIDFKAAEVIAEHQGQAGNYQKYVEALSNLIADKNFDQIADLVNDLENKIDLKEEEESVLNFLNQDLVEVLDNPDFSGPRQINGSILHLLIYQREVQDKFVKALLSNQEKISAKNIIIDQREQEASVANWIKHFIKENGSGMFSSIALAKYLTSSTVAQLLDDQEKKRLRKLIKLYRNLVFFPESLANLPRNDWEIIPLDKDAVVETEKKIPAKIEVPAVIPMNKKEVKVPDKKIEVPQTKPPAPIDLRHKELDELLELATKYPEKSLEYKAIQAEIKKINNKNKI